MQRRANARHETELFAANKAKRCSSSGATAAIQQYRSNEHRSPVWKSKKLRLPSDIKGAMWGQVFHETHNHICCTQPPSQLLSVLCGDPPDTLWDMGRENSKAKSQGGAARPHWLSCVCATSVLLSQFVTHCALACLLRRLNVHLSELSRKTQSHVRILPLLQGRRSKAHRQIA